MRPNGKIFEDVSSLVTNAMGVAQGAKEEAQNALHARIDRWLAERDLVTREEFDALRAMVNSLADENAALKAQISDLTAKSE